MKLWNWCANQSLIPWLPSRRYSKDSRDGYIIKFSCYRSASSAGGVLGDTSDLLASLMCS